MMLFTHAPLIATVACLGYCLSFSAITAFAFSFRPASSSAVKHSSANNHIMSTTSTSLHYSINRRAVFTTVVPVATFATLFIPPLATNEKYHARADEPNNVYYKSKADEDEDPLAVFGRSLQQSIPTSTIDGNNDVQQQEQGVEQSNNKATEELLPGGGDLGKALLEKQEERRIDPRTHG